MNKESYVGGLKKIFFGNYTGVERLLFDDVSKGVFI